MKADELIMGIEEEMEEVDNHLEHLIDYTINYFRQIKKKYGAGRERKTEIRSFDTIEATAVVAANQKLYLDREEGFAGTSLRKHEYICDCSDIDDIIVFRADGTFLVTKVSTKTFVGKDVIHIDVFKKGDDRTIYNMVYRDGKSGNYMVKRFPVIGITRDKDYTLTKGKEGSRVLYFSANPNGEAEVIRAVFRPNPKLKATSIEFDFSTLAIKGRGSYGNILTKKPVRSIVKKEEGVSTLGAREIWYDDTVKRLNVAERGTFLGAFLGSDKILTIMSTGAYRNYGFDLSTHFDEDMVHIEKFDERKIMTAIYYDGTQGFVYLKRFNFEASDKKVSFIGDHPDSKLMAFSLDYLPVLEVIFDDKANGREIEPLKIETADFIAVKGFKARGKRLSNHAIKLVRFLAPLPFEAPEGGADEDGDTIVGEEVTGNGEMVVGDTKETTDGEIEDAGRAENEHPSGDGDGSSRKPAKHKTHGKDDESQIKLEF